MVGDLLKSKKNDILLVGGRYKRWSTIRLFPDEFGPYSWLMIDAHKTDRGSTAAELDIEKSKTKNLEAVNVRHKNNRTEKRTLNPIQTVARQPVPGQPQLKTC